ncbi:MAG: hypothetical protein ACPGWS_01775 [Solirubrobacterales bacterium]
MTFSARWRQPGGMNRVRETFRRIEREMDAGKLVTWAAPKVVQHVKERTTSGDDIHDKQFAPYSTRSEAGRRYVQQRKGGRTSPVTLSDSGVMQGNLKARKKGRARIVVSVVGEGADRAVKHHRGLGITRRPWVGMSPSGMRELNRDTVLFVEKLLKLQGPGLRTAGGRPFRGKTPWSVRNPR